MRASRQRLFSFLSLIIILSLLLVACERPIPGNNADNQGDQDSTVTDLGGGAIDGTDPDAGGGAGDTNAGSTDSADEPGDDPYPPPPDDDDSDGDDGYPPPDDGDSDTGDGDSDTGDGDSDTGDGDSDTGDGDSDTGDGDSDTGDGDSDTGDGDSDTGDGDGDSDTGDGDSGTGDGESGDTPQTHTVARGENLYRIGLKYGISWVTLAQINNLHNPHHIYEGQVLKLSVEEEDNDEETGTGDVVPPEQDVEYIVKAGDTLYSISKAFGVDWQEVAKKNNLVNPNRILVGQTLIIPGTASETETTEPQRTHTVMRGETLFRISLKYGIPWTKIAEENEITSPHVIYPGQVLVIPED